MRYREMVGTVALSFCLASALPAAERNWQTGKILDIQSQMQQANYERRLYHIDAGGDLIHVAYEEGWAQTANAAAQVMSFGLAPKKKKFAEVTINDPVQFAIEGKKLYLLDERKKQTKLELHSKVRKPPVSTATAAPAAVPTPAPEISSSEIRRGMTPEEVEKALGKPMRMVTFEGRTQWQYPKLVIAFEQGRVSDVSF